MSKLFEQFKKETGDTWSYKNGWDFAPEEIVIQKYIEWLEQKLTSDNSDYAKCKEVLRLMYEAAMYADRCGELYDSFDGELLDMATEALK